MENQGTEYLTLYKCYTQYNKLLYTSLGEYDLYVLINDVLKQFLFTAL